MTEQMRQQVNRCIHGIADGDTQSLELLSSLVSGRMLVVAMSIVGNRAAAEDVVQEAFLRIVDKAKSFKRGTNGYAWICKITQNLALNTLRSQRRRIANNLDEMWDIAADDNVEEQSQAKLLLRQALSVLTAEERRAVVMRYFTEYTVRDIARATGTSKSSVQRTLMRAEEKMRRCIEDDGRT